MRLVKKLYRNSWDVIREALVEDIPLMTIRDQNTFMAKANAHDVLPCLFVEPIQPVGFDRCMRDEAKVAA